MQKNTVVWSGGKSQHSSTVQKCYTTKTPVVDCLWCSFVLPSANSSGQHHDTTGQYLFLRNSMSTGVRFGGCMVAVDKQISISYSATSE